MDEARRSLRSIDLVRIGDAATVPRARLDGSSMSGAVQYESAFDGGRLCYDEPDADGDLILLDNLGSDL